MDWLKILGSVIRFVWDVIQFSLMILGAFTLSSLIEIINANPIAEPLVTYFLGSIVFMVVLGLAFVRCHDYLERWQRKRKEGA